MAENVTLNPVVTFTNDTSAVNTVNSNYTTITNAFTDVLSRSGVSPNQMGSNLDMNSNQIINLPPPATANSPARLVDVVSPAIISSVPPVGTSGGVVGLLSGNNTYSGTSTFTNTVTIPSNNITRANLAQGVARSIIGVTGNATANVADIQGTTRQVLAVNTSGTGLVFAQPQGDQLLGTITNDSASTGNVGEYVTAAFNLVPLTTATPVSITQISMTAGDWDVNANMIFSGPSITTVNSMAGGLSLGSAVLNVNTPGFVNQSFASGQTVFAGLFGAYAFCTPVVRFSFNSTTIVYLVIETNFGTSTCSASGFIGARRAR